MPTIRPVDGAKALLRRNVFNYGEVTMSVRLIELRNYGYNISLLKN
jgi:hypothetical protein